MALDLYATTQSEYSAHGGFVVGDKLPSPVEVSPTHEVIWSEDTGRAQSGINKAKMIGSVVAQKRTYNIKWGVLTEGEFSSLKSKMPAGFYRFGLGTSVGGATSDSIVVYRSEINYSILPIGNEVYYKDVGCSVIEQ